jgi:hypothetical protein
LKFNLGCGGDIRSGWLNVDIIDCEGITWHDINRKPLAKLVDYIFVDNVLEHLDDLGIYNASRSLQSGGVLEGNVPHYLSRHAYDDFMHKHYFNEATFKNKPFKDFSISRLETWYCFGKHIKFKLPQWFVTLHERLLPGILPPSHIHFKLQKR